MNVEFAKRVRKKTRRLPDATNRPADKNDGCYQDDGIEPPTKELGIAKGGI